MITYKDWEIRKQSLNNCFNKISDEVKRVNQDKTLTTNYVGIYIDGLCKAQAIILEELKIIGDELFREANK